MRLVMQYEVTDDFTFSVGTSHQFVYKSAECALVDFESVLIAAHEKAKKTGIWSDSVFFANQRWSLSNFFDGDAIILPTILTLEEWFEGLE